MRSQHNCSSNLRRPLLLQANSGHPGLPMGCAPMSYVLWKDFMTVDPKVGLGAWLGAGKRLNARPKQHALRLAARSSLAPARHSCIAPACLVSQAPKWFNRDRFVLSAGHGSMLNYSLLHLMGYESVGVS